MDLAIQKGAPLGLPAVYISEEFKEVYKKWRASEMTAVEAMEGLAIKKATFYKLVKIWATGLK